MNAAKVQLSKEELTLVSDPQWILTKNSIMGRVVELLAGVSERLAPELEGLRVHLSGNDLPPNWDTPKISRGENYMGLPYVILDHPRLFSKEHILAIRTMFWWGNYFSVTLHVKGWMGVTFLPALSRHTRVLREAGFRIAITGDEWRHELETEHYMALTDGCIDPEGEYPFLKLSAKCPLDKWNEAPEILLGLCKVLMHALTA